MEDRIKGERASVNTRIAIDASPYSTLNTFKIDDSGTPNFNLRTSADTSSVKEIVTNVEEAISLGKAVYKEYTENCSVLHKELQRLSRDFSRQIEDIPLSILQNIENMRDSLRDSFVNQQEENMRFAKQINSLNKEKGLLVQTVNEGNDRLKLIEDSIIS